MNCETCSLYRETIRLAEDCGSYYRDTVPGRDALLEFMDMNEWFGQTPVFRGKDVFIDTIEPFKDRLELWLKAYKRTGAEKIDIMLEAYHEILPETCDRISAFMMDDRIKQSGHAYKMTDFVLSMAAKDLIFYSQEEMDGLISEGNKEMGLVIMRLFNKFMNFEYNGRKLSEWNYSFDSRQLVKQNRDAYSLGQYAAIAYAVFDQKFWAEQDLIKKACGRRRYADLWLYSAMLFMGAVRKGDFRRLPIPDLPYEGDEVRRRIIDGVYTREEARGVTEEFIFRIRMKPQKPHKSKKYAGIASIKIQVPESVKEQLGIIMSISMSFRNDGDPFVGTESDPLDVREFFGDSFADTVGDRILSRRANKSYLQGIAVEGDDELGRPKGYMLASLARSHKCSLDGISDVTEIYLRDAAFTGYTPQFILMEMFERGIFGFIPVLMLKMYAGKDFLRIGVSEQTKLIKQLGLNAFQIEEITESVSISLYKAHEVVEAVMDGKSHEMIGTTLQRIAAGAAPAKTDKFLCLMTAAGCGCVEPSRSGCMGCRYEIYTKSSVQLLVREYIRLCKKLKAAAGTERIRIKKLLKNGVMPCIAEIISSIEMMYPDADMDTIYEIAERGLELNDDITGRE